jgi:CRISPR-associated protein Cas2
MTRLVFHNPREGRQVRVRKKIHALVIYDITDDKRRLQIAKLLTGYGFRVQYSGFEVVLDRARYLEMMRRILYTMDAQDNIRVYRINSEGDISVLGKGDVRIPSDVVVL